MKRFDPNAGGEGNLGFQIAPMIDVVCVIMLFFMVMAGAVRVERELNTKLPGTAETSGPTELVDEITINIAQNGELMLNDEPMDTPTSKELPQLRGAIMRLKQTGAMLQKKGDSYDKGKGGIPELPLWLFGALSEAVKKLYRESFGDKAFSGLVSNARGGTGSLLDALKR